MTTKLDKVLYTAQAHTTGGRDGAGKTSDGANRRAAELARLRQARHQPRAAVRGRLCGLLHRRDEGRWPKIKVQVPQDVAIDSSVSLGPTKGGAAYGIAVKLAISLPGLDAEQKKTLVDAAHQVCPYSNATRGNIDVDLEIL